eukprot:m51a1_g5081 hypothetical protein (1134) ;mRNA; r:234991-239264
MDDSALETALAAVKSARAPADAASALQSLASRAQQAFAASSSSSASGGPSAAAPPGSPHAAPALAEGVLDAIRTFASEPKVVEQACRALGAISVSPKCQVEIARRGGADYLCAALKAAGGPSTESLRRYALRALRNVSSCQEGQQTCQSPLSPPRLYPDVIWHGPSPDGRAAACEKAGALEAVLSAMSAHRSEAELLKVACGMLRNSALRGGDLRSAPALASALDAALSAAAAHPANAEVQEAALGAVWGLAAVCGDGQVAMQAPQWVPAIDAASAALAAHKDSAPVVESGLRAVAFVCAGGTELRRTAAIARRAVPVVVAAMSAQAGNASVQERGCLALANLAGGTQDTQAAAVRGGGVEAAHEALAAHVASSTVAEHALAALYNMALLPEGRVMIAQRPACLAAASEAMATHRAVAQLQLNGCRLFGILSTTRDCQFAVSQCGAPEAASAALLAHAANASVVENALWALANISICQSSRAALTKAQATVDAVTAAMTAHRNVVNVQESGCRVLGNIGAGAATLEAVLASMEAHRASAAVQQAGCGAIWRLMCASSANRAAATTARCAEVVLAGMAAHRGAAGVQKHGCHVLMELALKNQENGSAVARMGGVRACLRAMRKHKDSAAVQEVACGALRNMAASPVACEVVVAHEGVESVVRCMADHPAAEPIADHATAVLCRVSARVKGPSAAVLATQAVVGAVVAAMGAHVGSRSVQKHSCAFLWNVQGSNPDFVAAAQDNGVLGAVLASMRGNRECATLQDSALKLLSALSTPANRPVLARLGAVSVLASVLSANRSEHSIQNHCHDLLERLGEYADDSEGLRIRADLLRTYQSRYAVALYASTDEIDVSGAVSGEGNNTMLSAKHRRSGEALVVKLLEADQPNPKFENERQIMAELPMNEGISHYAAVITGQIPQAWQKSLPDRPRLRGWTSANTRLHFVISPFHGESLSFVLQIQSKPVTLRIAKEWLRQLITAIAFLGENNIAHRDIIPEHILIDSNNRVKLIDLGTAVRCKTKSLACTVEPGRPLWGHQATVPPEVAAKQEAAARGPVELSYAHADMFAAALSFWDSLSPLGIQKPRAAGQAFNTDPTILEPLPLGLDGLNRVLTMMMNKDPEARPGVDAALAILSK